jgi:hypothetical protein
MPPLARADAASEAWALSALGPLLCASARAVYPLPGGGATHALLLPAANRERALRVTQDATAMVQAAALRVAFLQLSSEDGALYIRAGPSERPSLMDQSADCVWRRSGCGCRRVAAPLARRIGTYLGAGGRLLVRHRGRGAAQR